MAMLRFLTSCPLTSGNCALSVYPTLFLKFPSRIVSEENLLDTSVRVLLEEQVSVGDFWVRPLLLRKATLSAVVFFYLHFGFV